jgi:predicted dehydrogenase
MSLGDGASYAPESQSSPVVSPGEFRFGVTHLDHDHIYGQTQGLIDAGGLLVSVYDPDEARLNAFLKAFPQTKPVKSLSLILEDPSLSLIASAAVPDQRADLGVQVMRHGKDYFTDKSPFTTLQQLSRVKRVVEETNRRYFVYYAERLHNEAAWYAGQLLSQGVIGRVLHVLSIAPHRLSPSTRPDWFFKKARYGGIITDIGSHQVEQFLTYGECGDAEVSFAQVTNHAYPEYPELEDFGEFALTGDNGVSFYSRVDWFTPDGSEVWGDGRTFVTGTDGSMEVRKYVDPNRAVPAAKIFLTDRDGLREIDCLGRVGYPFFGQLILDSLNGTEQAMSQAHIFKAAELSMQAQMVADEFNKEHKS